MTTRKKTTTQPKKTESAAQAPVPFGFMLLTVAYVIDGHLRARPVGLGENLIHWSEARRVRKADGSNEKGAAALHTRDAVLFVEESFEDVMAKIARAQAEGPK